MKEKCQKFNKKIKKKLSNAKLKKNNNSRISQSNMNKLLTK